MHAEDSIGSGDGGCSLFHSAGCPRHVEAGGVLLIGSGSLHACNPVPGAPWSFRMLFVDADWLHARLGVAALRFPRRSFTDADIASLVDGLCRPVDGTAAADRRPLARGTPRTPGPHPRPFPPPAGA